MDSRQGALDIVMKTLITAVLAVVALSTPAFAEGSPLSGAWRLSAKVASVPFKLLCRFEQMGDRLGGTCVNDSGARPGHELTLAAGHVDGDHVSFKHEGHFLLNKFDVNYQGVVAGDRIDGQIAVFGHTGDFTAVRAGS
jgi:hypothetical protein